MRTFPFPTRSTLMAIAGLLLLGQCASAQLITLAERKRFEAAPLWIKETLGGSGLGITIFKSPLKIADGTAVTEKCCPTKTCYCGRGTGTEQTKILYDIYVGKYGDYNGTNITPTTHLEVWAHEQRHVAIYQAVVALVNAYAAANVVKIGTLPYVSEATAKAKALTLVAAFSTSCISFANNLAKGLNETLDAKEGAGPLAGEWRITKCPDTDAFIASISSMPANVAVPTDPGPSSAFTSRKRNLSCATNSGSRSG